MPKRILQGTVTSDKNDQTVTVLVERRFKHPLLQKTVRKTKKYRAHDAQNQFRVVQPAQRPDFGRHVVARRDSRERVPATDRVVPGRPGDR